MGRPKLLPVVCKVDGCIHLARTVKSRLCNTHYTQSLTPEQKQRRKNYRKQYGLKNKTSILQKARIYRENNKDKISATRKRYYIDNKDEVIIKSLKWREQNRGRINSRANKRNQRMRERVIRHYCSDNPRCMCPSCECKNIHFLSVDHINGGGRRHRQQIGGNLYSWLIRNKFPDGFRILCYNCNFSMGHYGFCHDKVINDGSH